MFNQLLKMLKKSLGKAALAFKIYIEQRIWKPKTAGEQEGGRGRLAPPLPGYAPALAAVIT